MWLKFSKCLPLNTSVLAELFSKNHAQLHLNCLKNIFCSSIPHGPPNLLTLLFGLLIKDSGKTHPSCGTIVCQVCWVCTDKILFSFIFEVEKLN